MSKIYARLVREHGMDIEAVPALWREQTRVLLSEGAGAPETSAEAGE